MKRALHVGAAMVSALLLSAAAASAQVVVATTTLTSGEETPALLTGAAGTAEVAIDTVAKEFAVTLRVFNIPTTTCADAAAAPSSRADTIAAPTCSALFMESTPCPSRPPSAR